MDTTEKKKPTQIFHSAFLSQHCKSS